jgi:predicted  nucleic acid-binding Zn-ribbon protein
MVRARQLDLFKDIDDIDIILDDIRSLRLSQEKLRRSFFARLEMLGKELIELKIENENLRSDIKTLRKEFKK